MTNIVSIASARAAKKKSGKANTLCRNGHHKWQIDKAKQFDVKQGKLVTIYRCQRCGKLRVTTD